MKENLIYIIFDDLSDFAVDGLRYLNVTPNLNKLIAGGARFTNHHTTAPICGPARAAVGTGLHPRTTGYCGI